MGYYTNYSLDIKGVKSKEVFEKICDKLREEEIVDNILGEGHYDEDESYAYFYCMDSARWCEHDKDMLKISTEFPECTFLLEGHEEGSDDFWREYYNDGNYEYCQGRVIYEEPRMILW